jgi:hypothetical protein
MARVHAPVFSRFFSLKVKATQLLPYLALLSLLSRCSGVEQNDLRYVRRVLERHMVADVPLFVSLEGTIFSWGRKKGQKTKKSAKKRPQKGERKGATTGSFFLPQFGTDYEHAARGALRSLARLADVLQFARDGKKKKSAFLTLGFSFFLFLFCLQREPRHHAVVQVVHLPAHVHTLE